MSVFDELGLPDPSRQQAAPASVFAEFGLPEPIAQPPAGGLAAAAKQAIGAGIKGAGRAAADFIPGVTPANPISQYGQEVIDANPTAVQSFSDIADSPWTAVKEAVGNAGGSMAGMLGARALGTGITMAAPFTGPAAPLVGLAGQAIANVGPFVAAALPSYGGIREEQIKADPANAADAKSKAIAMLGAGAVGAIEGAFGPEAWALAAAKKGGIEAMVKKLADAKSIPAAIGKGIMRGGAIEGAEELVQNPIEQVAGYQDPTTRQAIGETLFGGAMGAIGGGVMGGGMGGFAKAMEPAQTPPPAATAAPTQGTPPTTGSPPPVPYPATPTAVPPAAIDPVADPLGTLANPAAGIMSRTAATGEITGANEQKRQEQAIVEEQTTGATNEGTPAIPVPPVAGNPVPAQPVAGTPATPVPPAAGTTAPAQPVAGSPSSVADTVAQAAAAEEAAANSAALSQGGAAAPSPAAAVPGGPIPAAIDPEIIKRRAQAYYDAGKARVDEGYFDEGLHLMEQGDAILRGEQPVPFGGATASESQNPAADPEREKRARFYESMADEREARGDTEGIIKAAEYRQTAASLRAGNPASPTKGKNESGNQTEKAVKAKKGQEEKPNETPDSTAVDVGGLSIAAPPDARPAPVREDAVKFAESRTDGQLAVLAKSGRPGYKEAAVAEISRRSGMSPKSVSGTSEKSSEVAAQENKLPATPVPAVGEPLLSGGAGNEMSAGNVGDTLPAPKAARTATTISDDEYKAIADDARYLKDIVYSIANLVGDDKKTILRLSSRLGKSGRDTILMDALNIDRDLAHTINNRLDDKQPRSLRSQDMEDAFAKFPALRRIVEEAKQGSQPVVTNEIAPDAPQAPLSSAGETQAPRKNLGTKSNPPPIMRRDDLVGAIMRVTGGNGIHSSMAPDTVGDNANRATKLRGLFTNRGTTDLGDVAMLLRESESFDVRDGEHLSEMIRQASFGDVPVSMERQERDAESDKERQHRERVRAQAKKYGIKTVGVKFSDLESRVLAMMEARTKKAVEALDERAKRRFDAALAEAESLLSEDEIDAALADTSKQGLAPRGFWNTATGMIAGMVQDAKERKAQKEFDELTEGPEPDWINEDDGLGNQPAGGGNAAGQGDQAQPGEGFTLAGQSPADLAKQEADRVAEERAQEAAKARAAADEKAAADRKAIKQASEAAASTFELGGDAMDNLTGQGSVFDAPPPSPAPVKKEEPPAISGYKNQPESFDWAAKDVGGKVVYSHGDIALLEGFSLFGNPVYTGIKGDSRTSVDIESYTGKMFSDAEKAELLKARSEHIAEQDRLHATNPDGPFNGGARFAKTDGISAELAGVAQKWLSMLGIKARIFLATKADVSSAEAIDQYGLRGPFAAIRSAGVKREEDGGMRVLPNGDYYIILPPSNRQSAALETLAHEIGHLLEKEEWKSADQATKDAVMADYQKWLATAGNTSAKEWVTQLRAHTTGKQVGNIPNTTADKLPAYWRSFGEYFADQVSKWATTTDKPLTAVDAFFKRIALAMRRLYSMLAGKPYLPTDAMKKYLDSRSADAPLAPPAAKQSKSTASTSAANTEDAGSELTYNRRNRLNRGLKWADIADKDEALRVKEATKAKVYPKPDYKAMIGGGMAPQLAHIVKQVYDSISAAPQTRRSAAPSDDDIKNYIAGVNRVMDAVVGWANDADRGGKWLAYTVESSLRAYGGARSLIAAAGNNDVGQSLLSIAFPDGYEPVKNELIAIGGNKVYGALQPHSRELQDAIKDIKAGWPEPQESWQRQGFSIINGDGVKADPVAGDYGRLSVTVRMTAPNETFSRTLRVISVDGTRDIASPEVRSAIDRGLAEFAGRFVLLNKTKSVVSTHATEEEAKEAARAQARRSGRASTVSDKGISVVAAERTGADRRMPGEDISSDRLRDTFKFKGVNFGNWMKGDTNTKERQIHLNHAYDAFFDLADVLGVPPEAMSLNGMLGVAIGAQGHGGNAAAHFVPGVNEINLTRESGAGSLAHEWGHALDHYFARQAGLTRATGPFLTSHLKAAAGSELRPEILDKFKTIVQAMHKRPMTPEEAAAKRQEGIASARRNLDGWLKSVILGDLMDDPEVSKAIERIKSGDLGDGSVAVGRTSVVKPAIADLGKIIKEKTGRVLQRTDLSAIDSWAGKLKYLQGQNDGDAAHVPQQIVETQYFKAATSLDKDKGGKPYWSTTLEMFARAFDAFVSDTLEAKAAKNSYLSHAGRGGETVPAGGERTAINAAIQGLVDAVETKAGEDGNVLLYNVAADDNPGLSAAIEGAKAAREQMNRFREDSPVEDADSYFDIIGKVIAADKAVAAKIAEIADDGFAVMAKTRDGRMVTLTKSAQRSGKYQVTTFGKDGAPWGDTQHDTKMGAAKQFVEDVDVNTIEVADGINYNVATDTKSSPSDRAIYSMVAEGKTAAEILSFIGKASRRPFNRYLANALRNLGASSTLTLDSQGGWRFGNASQAQRYAAAYNPKTDTVALFTARDAERHILHEFVHSQTLKAIAAGGPASLQMRALFLHIKRNGSLDGQYGMSNLDEFVAEAFSNPKFQAALKAIPAPKGSGMQNAWQWFVRAVARALGIKTAAMETALDRAMVEGAKLMRENAALSGQMDGSDRYALAWHGTPHVWAPEPGFPHGRPRLDKMGTGEGAQAYGWGWYSAQEKETAEWYRRNVSGAAARVSLDGSPLLGGHYGTWPGKFGISSAVADRLNMWRAMAESGKSTSVADAPASLRKRLSISQVGNTYQLDIPDDVMPNLLDWDKPLSEQTAQVRNALLRAGVTITKSTYPTLKQAAALFRSARVQREAASDIGVRESLREGWLAVQSGNQSAFNKWFDKHGSTLSPGRKMDRTGEALYEEFSSSKEGNLGYSKQRASEYLASIGIVGTRYLDGNSRSDGAGTHNYVIWDQKTLDRIALLERNGEKLDAIREADAARYNVEPLPDTITINGVERPTTNSNGKQIAQDEASIRRFWEWFGDSRVVDEQGRPLVVYHGTSNDFARFNLKKLGENTIGEASSEEIGQTSRIGHWFSSHPMGRSPDNYGAGYSIDMPVYLKITNQFSVEENDDLAVMLEGGKKGATLRKELASEGYDGVRIKRDTEFEGSSFIAFAGSQAKSATGNNGQFSPNNPDIRYSAATDWYDNNAPQSVKSVVANALRSDAKTSWLTPFNTQYHKAEKWAKEGKVRFKRVFDLVQKFLGDVSRFAVMAQSAAPTLFHEWRTLADVRATLSSGDLLGKQHRADVAAIASPLYEGTLYGGGNPMSGIKWSDAQLRTKFSLTDRQIKLYREALSAVNVSMDELAKSIVAQHAKANNIRFDREAGLADMIRDVTEGLESAKEDLEALLDQSEKERVDGEAADLRDMDMNQEADSLLAQFERDQKEAAAGVARIEKTISDVKEIGAKNAKLQAAGYFPLMRFGKHTVTATDQDGKVQFFGMYEGLPLVPRSGQYEANKVAAELRAAFPEWTVETGIKNDEKYKLYQGLNIEAIQLFAEHMDKESLEPFQEFIRLATNNRSAQRRLLHRQGTPGFDKDVRRTLAQFMVSNARAASSNYHVQDMLRAAADAEKDGGDIGSEAVKLVNYVRNPTEEAQALRGFLFFQFLGGSLASAAVNLTQTPMMTLPFLSQFEPAGALIQRLTQAAKLAVQKVEKIPNQRLREALERAEMDGVTAPQEIYQLTATAANNIFAGSRLASALLRGWGAPFAMAEGFNRRIAFISAFQIAEKMGAADLLAKTGFRDAFAFAEDAVNQTQGIYNKGNRMNVGRGTAGSVLMTFKQYSIMYLELLKRLPTKQRAIMVGLLVLAAGGGGLPGVEDAEDLWDTIGQWLGFASNSKRTLRNTLTEWMGRDAADMAMNGLLSRVGIDLHGRMGMHNLIPGTGIMKQSSVDKGRDLEEFFGPAASVVKSVGDALESLATGHPDRAAMALAPSAVRNLAQGAKMADKGYSEDAKGRKGVPVNGAESGAKMIGFNPKSVADYGAIKRDLAQDQRLVGVKREEFSSAIADAIIADDPAARAEAMQSLLAWNAENPSARVTITSAAIAKRVRDARAEGATRMLRSLPKGMRSQAREEFAQ